MSKTARPFRSLLYIPGSKKRALEKAQTLPADGIIFDLEDAVGVDEKDSARQQVADVLTNFDYGNRSLMVRVNGFETNWINDDLDIICAAAPAAILLPKVRWGADIVRLSEYLDANPNTAETRIWAMMESPLSVLNAQEIAASSPRLQGMVLGTNDLIKDLNARHTASRAPVHTSMEVCLLAARAYGLICINGVYNAFRDGDGLRRMCQQDRDMGYDGKSLIHPSQIEIANEIFAPSKDDLELAKRQIAAFEQARSQGQGIAVLDGSIVEYLHIVAAKSLLAKAEAIVDLNSDGIT